jgi:4-hydroxy-tetrahydrodipicolinate reductase
MGVIACEAVDQAPDLTLGAVIGRNDDRGPFADCDVAIDLTTPASVEGNVAWCIDAGLSVVVGTSGWRQRWLEELPSTLDAASDVGVIVAPNFSIGAALMQRFAAQAAPHFPSVEVIELHHPRKADAPSGTAMETARRVARHRNDGVVPDSGDRRQLGRGASVDGVRVHAVRLSGLLAHQQVLFGLDGETLTIQHDSYDRRSFMPGILLAVRAVRSRPGLTIGLEPLLGEA